MSSIKKEIKAFVLSYFDVYFKKRDLAELMKFLSPDMTVIGTGAHEYSSNSDKTFELYRIDLNEIIVPIQYSKPSVHVQIIEKNIASVTGRLSIKGESNGLVFHIPELRYSAFIQKSKGEWKIQHLHISVPNNQQEDDELYPLQNVLKQNELLNQIVDERTKELQELNNQLQISNQTKDTLLSVISHDLRSPFNGMLGFVKMLKENFNDFDTESQQKFVDLIDESSQKVYQLLDNLLTWSNLQRNGFEYSPEPVNVKKLCDEILLFFSDNTQKKNISILNNIQKPIVVLSNEFMLSVIVRNLVSNAIKFTNPGGEICIESKKLNQKQITICVKDTGIGMDETKVNNLFSQHSQFPSKGTNNEMGTGLGLLLCKEFIDLHETEIWAESEPNKGSVFCFNLNLV
jgi:signal transduction histidine kinase